MKLPDFLNFDPFNDLRQRMGAEALGDFVFFDPRHHLTGLELLALNNTGLDATAKELRILDDFTLAYKNARVLVYRLIDQEQEMPVFHLADCAKLHQWQASELPVKVTNGELEVGQVCEGCLHRLSYQGFDSVRQRHRDYSQRIFQGFDVAGFFKKYPSYPVEQASAPVF